MHDPFKDGSPPQARRFLDALSAFAAARRRRRLAEGLSLAVVVAALALLAGAFAIDAYKFSPEAVRVARTVFYVLLSAALAGLVLPVLLDLSDRSRTAARLEEENPEFDGLLLAAADASSGRAAGDPSPGLVSRMWDDAAAALDARRDLRVAEGRRVRRAAALASGAAIACAALVALGPPGLRLGAGLVLAPAADPAASTPYRIVVEPGDTRIRAGADQQVAARTEGFRPESLSLFQRAVGDEGQAGEWKSAPMREGEDAFDSILLGVTASLEYYVAGEGVTSDRYRIDVEPLPEVARIDLVYRYPPRTGRAEDRVENRGDIRAVEDTVVEVRVTPSMPLTEGVLRLDDRRELPLTPDGDQLVARLDVKDDGFYRVDLPAFDGALVRASRDYRIDAMVDTRPEVRVTAPGGDIDVTSIEEIDIEIAARDDVALGALELVVWFNDGEEEVFAFDAPPGPDVVRASQRFYLEDRDLSPGDLIAYHARATDVAGEPARTVTSDIFFMQVRPFDRRFTQASGGGGGGGGGQGGESGVLSAQQRQLVIALFKLRQMLRGANADDGVVADRIDTLSGAQADIRDRVDAIVQRLKARQIPGIQATIDPMIAELPKASDAMLRVEALLEAADVGGSLESARVALRHLQRADAGFREMQVAMNRGGGGGSAANDLSNLFRLEMDRFRSQYEHVQRGRWESPERRLDDALRKLAELAQRQQRELERSAADSVDGGSEAQRELAERVEELLRQLERLTRNRPERELAEAMEAAREAARSMNEGGDAESRRQALDKLRQAERSLRELSGGRQGIAGEIGEALRQAESLVDRQGEIEHDVESLRETPLDADLIDRIVRAKQELTAGARSLDDTLERLDPGADGETAGGSQDDRSAGENLSEALERSRRSLAADQLDEMITRSRAGLWDEQTEAQAETERAIRGALESARDALAEARDVARGASGDGAALAEALRDMVRGQDRLQRRLREGARAGSESAGGPRSADGSTQSAGGDASGGSMTNAGPTGGAAQQGVAIGGIAGGGSIGNRFDMADARRMLLDDARRLESMRGAVAPTARERGEIDHVVDALRALGESGDDLHEIVREHAAIVSRLKDLERLARGAGEDERRGLVVRERSEPGEGYREIVEEYYRRLGESRGGSM